MAILTTSGTGARVISLSPKAHAAGVQIGSSLAQARSVCAELRTRVASLALERSARQALLDAALSVSPRVEEAAPGSEPYAGEAAVFLDATGVEALFGSESGWATALVTRAERLGVPARVTVASSRLAAHLLARDLAGARTVRTVAKQEELSLLAPLPVDSLALDDPLADLLTRLGIQQLGPLLRWPRRLLLTRLGREIEQRVARIRGELDEPPLRPPAAQAQVEESDLEAAVDRLEPLSFVLRPMLERLLGRLGMRRRACDALELTLGLAGGGHDRRRLALAAPTLDVRVLLRRVRLALESAPPSAPVELVSLSAVGCPPRTDQLDLFRPAGPSPSSLDALLAELESLCGPGRVGAPEVPDTHHPGAFALRPFGGFASPSAKRRERTTAPLVVRALRPPVAAQVQLRAGRPAWIRSAVANGDVVHCSGPWRITGGWWSAEGRFAFDHYDLSTQDGLLVRLRFDHRSRSWEVDAVYD